MWARSAIKSFDAKPPAMKQKKSMKSLKSIGSRIGKSQDYLEKYEKSILYKYWLYLFIWDWE